MHDVTSTINIAIPFTRYVLRIIMAGIVTQVGYASLASQFFSRTYDDKLKPCEKTHLSARYLESHLSECSHLLRRVYASRELQMVWFNRIYGYCDGRNMQCYKAEVPLNAKMFVAH